MIAKITIFFTLLVVSFVPRISHAALVACDGGTAQPCGWAELIQTFSNIMNFLLFTIATPLFTILFVYAGVLFMTSKGNPAKLTAAKSTLLKVVGGYIIAIAAWLIVATLLKRLGVDNAYVWLNFTL